jgi:hypothetical protein
MTIQRKTLGDGVVGPEKLAAPLREHRYFYEPFNQTPIIFNADGYSDPSLTNALTHHMFTGYNLLQYSGLDENTGVVVPALTTDGYLDIGREQTLAHGMELVFASPLATAHPRHYTMGTDEPYFRVKFKAEDVSGIDLTIGFRKVQAFAAALATYTDIIGLRVLGDSSSAAGAITVVSTLNDATDITSTTLAETLADDTAIEFEVRFNGRVADYRIDGAAPTVTPTAFTADSADVYTPFIYFLNTTDVGGEMKLMAAEGGLMADHPGGTL